MAHLSIGVLGSLQVSLADAPITALESVKVRALLAYLAVEVDHPHRRETLIGLLWPDFPEESARHNLRQALFNLRSILGDKKASPPYLLSTRDAIYFNQESDYSLDLAQFNTFFLNCEEHLPRCKEDCSIRAARLEEIVKLYRGEFLEQLFLEDSTEFEEWVLAQRENMHQRALEAHSYLTNYYKLHGDFQSARRHASRQLELDPWREEAHRQMMQMLALDGERSAAMAQYETCKQILAKELDVEPSAETRELYEQIRLGTLSQKANPPTSISAAPVCNLPVQLTPFIGREQELADIKQYIADPECRLITLIGPGGIGKTRLSLQAARKDLNEFTHGAAFVPLAAVSSIEAVIQAIANAVNFTFYGPSNPKVQLFNHLQEKQMLLILDNMEHLLADGIHQANITGFLIEFLVQAPMVKLMVTSREALNLQVELPYEIRGLAYPEMEQTEGIEEYAAVALFRQRARRARPAFVLNAENMNGVVRICHLVEGMPLALELAAAWVRILSPAEIAKEIESSLDFLSVTSRDMVERHQSMRVVFDHSWEMLSADEQRVLSQLSIFRGGFQRRAAEQVTGASLSILSALIIRSLLRRTATGRYELHELVRQYASSKLASIPREQENMQERHSNFYLAFLQEREPMLRNSHQKDALVELTAEMNNIWAAWEWSVAYQDPAHLCRVSATLMNVFEKQNWFVEGEVAFRNAAEALRRRTSEDKVGDGSKQGEIYQIAIHAMLAHSAYFSFNLGKSEEAYAALALSSDFLRSSADQYSAIYALWYFGLVCWIMGRFVEANESLQEGLTKARNYGDRWYEALIQEYLGVVAHDQGVYSDAHRCLSEALAIARQLGDTIFTAHVLSYLCRTTQSLGEYDRAEKLLRESLALAREIDYHYGVGMALDGLGQVEYARGRNDEARSLFLESYNIFREIGQAHRMSGVLNHQGFNSLAIGDAAEAQDSFRTALRLAYEGGMMPSALDALAGLLALQVDKEDYEGTLELAMCVLQHQASTQEAKDFTRKQRAICELHLTQEQVEAAQERASSMSFDELVRQVLAES